MCQDRCEISLIVVVTRFRENRSCPWREAQRRLRLLYWEDGQRKVGVSGEAPSGVVGEARGCHNEGAALKQAQRHLVADLDACTWRRGGKGGGSEGTLAE